MIVGPTVLRAISGSGTPACAASSKKMNCSIGDSPRPPYSMRPADAEPAVGAQAADRLPVEGLLGRGGGVARVGVVGDQLGEVGAQLGAQLLLFRRVFEVHGPSGSLAVASSVCGGAHSRTCCKNPEGPGRVPAGSAPDGPQDHELRVARDRGAVPEDAAEPGVVAQVPVADHPQLTARPQRVAGPWNMVRAVASVVAWWEWNGGLLSTRSTLAGGSSASPSPTTNSASASGPVLALKVSSAEATAWYDSSTKVTVASGLASAADSPTTPFPQPRSTTRSGPLRAGRWPRKNRVPMSRRSAQKIPAWLMTVRPETGPSPSGRSYRCGQGLGVRGVPAPGVQKISRAFLTAREVRVGPMIRSKSLRVEVWISLTIPVPMTTVPGWTVARAGAAGPPGARGSSGHVPAGRRCGPAECPWPRAGAPRPLPCRCGPGSPGSRAVPGRSR